MDKIAVSFAREQKDIFSHLWMLTLLPSDLLEGQVDYSLGLVCMLLLKKSHCNMHRVQILSEFLNITAKSLFEPGPCLRK